MGHYPAGMLGGGSPSWDAVTGKPSEFPPEAHSQAISTVTGLQTALDGKQAAGSYAAASHNHDASYSAIGHAHTAANITDFSEAVDDRVAALLLQGANVTLTYNDGANSLTVAASGSGSDPWTYVRLTSDFTTTSATAVDITGLAFTPTADNRYEFEALLLVRTATATVGPRPGVTWATGGSDGVASIYMPSSVSAEVQQHGNINAAVLAPVGGLPNTTQSYPAKISGMFIAGASPSGTVKLQLASETAGTTVTAKAGSWLKYRTVP